MNTLTYFVGPVLAIALLGSIVLLLMRGRLRERHALWWVLGAVVALVLGLFPALLIGISSFLGFEAPINLVLILSISLLLLVNLQHSSELTALEDRVRTLSERVAELEMAVSQRDLNETEG